MFKRKPVARKIEAERGTKNIISTSNYDRIGSLLGINRAGRNYSKIQFELNRLKNPRTRKTLGITDQDLKDFGIE